jgi:hypothetical protein
MLRIPHCLDNRLIDGGEVVSLTPQKHFSATVLLKELRKLRNSMTSSGLEPTTFWLVA